MPRRRTHTADSCLAAILLAAMWGCAGGELSSVETAKTGIDAASVARSLLGGTDHGLQVRKWHVVDRGEIGSLLQQFSVGTATDEATAERLNGNGFRLVRIHAEDVEMLQSALGGTPFDMDGWLGQVVAWRAVAAQTLDESGDAFAVDGRVRRFGGGELRVEARGWTLLMEDGPVLQLELRATHDRSRSSRLEQVLGREAFRGEVFHSLTAEMTLEQDYAYVLTCESPAVAWSEDDADESDGSGGSGAVGPGVVTPLTVGERLLKVETSPLRRELILFIPRIPSGLYPADTIAAGTIEAET